MKKKTINILTYTCAFLIGVLLVGGVSYLSKGFTDWGFKNDLKSSSVISSKEDNLNTSESLITSEENTSSESETSSIQENLSSNSEINKIQTLTIVDGSIDTSLNTSYVDETTNFSYEIKGLSSLSNVIASNQYCSELSKTYTRAINTGGGCSGSKYIKFVVPSNLKVNVRVVGSATSSQNIFITNTIQSTYSETNYLSLQVANNSWVVSELSEDLTSGTYYINFSGNVKIAEIDINFN